MSTDSAPYVAGSDTSQSAAESITSDLGRLEALVYKIIASAGLEGRTDDELEVATQLAHQTISARRRTLVLKGRVCDSGHRRRTRSGRKAVVWMLGLDPNPASIAISPCSTGKAVAQARKRALEDAVAAIAAKRASYKSFTDQAAALDCEQAVHQLLEKP